MTICYYKSNYQAIKGLSKIPMNEELRHSITGLVLIAVPLETEGIDYPSIKKNIDNPYMITLSSEILREFCDINTANFQEKINDYLSFIKEFEVPHIHRRKGYEDILKYAFNHVKKMRKSDSSKELGKTVEEMLPKYYRALGFGQGDSLTPKKYRKALKQEYLLFCRAMKRCL